MNIGERIKDIRLKKGITQKALAKKLGIATNSLSRYEIGERIPSLNMIEKIAIALDIDPLELVYGDTEKLTAFKEFQHTVVVNAAKLKKTILQNALDDTIEKYNRLNAKGRDKANDYITDLTKIDEYTTSDTNTQENEEANE